MSAEQIRGKCSHGRWRAGPRACPATIREALVLKKSAASICGGKSPTATPRGYRSRKSAACTRSRFGTGSTSSSRKSSTLPRRARAPALRAAAGPDASWRARRPDTSMMADADRTGGSSRQPSQTPPPRSRPQSAAADRARAAGGSRRRLASARPTATRTSASPRLPRASAPRRKPGRWPAQSASSARASSLAVVGGRRSHARRSSGRCAARNHDHVRRTIPSSRRSIATRSTSHTRRRHSRKSCRRLPRGARRGGPAAGS